MRSSGPTSASSRRSPRRNNRRRAAAPPPAASRLHRQQNRNRLSSKSSVASWSSIFTKQLEDRPVAELGQLQTVLFAFLTQGIIDKRVDLRVGASPAHQSPLRRGSTSRPLANPGSCCLTSSSTSRAHPRSGPVLNEPILKICNGIQDKGCPSTRMTFRWSPKKRSPVSLPAPGGKRQDGAEQKGGHLHPAAGGG